MNDQALALWVITERPRDYPNHFVLRRQFVLASGVIEADCEATIAATIEELRESLPADAVRLERQPDDDPVIVEVWI